MVLGGGLRRRHMQVPNQVAGGVYSGLRRQDGVPDAVGHGLSAVPAAKQVAHDAPGALLDDGVRNPLVDVSRPTCKVVRLQVFDRLLDGR